MINLTKLVCDLLSAGAQISTESAPKIANSVSSTLVRHLPHNCDAYLDEIHAHIMHLQCLMKK